MNISKQLIIYEIKKNMDHIDRLKREADELKSDLQQRLQHIETYEYIIEEIKKSLVKLNDV